MKFLFKRLPLEHMVRVGTGKGDFQRVNEVCEVVQCTKYFIAVRRDNGLITCIQREDIKQERVKMLPYFT